MLRRFTLLAVLLLTLSVIAPAVMACSVDDGCCSTDEAPCGLQPVAQPACCVEQPAQALIAAAAREHQPLDLRLPAGPTPAVIRLPSQRYSTCSASAKSPGAVPDQQLLYLLTGRLRL